MKKQFIYLITHDKRYSDQQIEEISKIFKRYDIKIKPNIVVNNKAEIRALLETKSNPDEEILAALNITTHFNYAKDGLSQSAHGNGAKLISSALVPAQEACIVNSYRIDNGELVCKSFDYATEGYLTDILNSRLADDIELEKSFILKNTLLTYSDLEKYDMKNTSQGLAVSKFICDEIYYPAPINLNFNPQKQNGTIDFRNDPADFLNNNIYFNNKYAVEYGITNLFHVVLNRGVFFRSPKNRREKNYWCPALNAGLPLVPKRDVIHEITYMAHDFSHFLIPDLLYTGKHSAQNQQTYIAYRMMSEAFTLVLADMVFVDSLKKSGFEYDYTRRKIQPLFEEFEIDLSKRETFFSSLRQMLRGSVDYCLKGDDSTFYKLSLKYRDNSPNLDNFKHKYMKFFCEDFKWTRHNYNCFRKNSVELAKWWDLVSPLREKAQLDTETIEEFSAQIEPSSEHLIDNIFNIIYGRVSSILQQPPVAIEPFEKRQLKAFFRYMMGQMLIMVRYENVVREAKVFQKIIINYLFDIKDVIRIENIDFCRSILAEFVDILLERNLIHYDDAQTFKEVFPVFEPNFAFYDEKIDFYKDLSSVAYESIFLG